MQLTIRLLISLTLILCLAIACKKDDNNNPDNTSTTSDNPFNDPTQQAPTDTSNNVTALPELDPNSLAGIHQNILVPTCANSGCHDGTFEPDFRTIQSSYNTMVNHPAINTDSTRTIRVVPSNVAQSMLYYRLTEFLPNSSGIMPLASNESDWEENKNAYLENIQNWINNGAPNN